MQSNHPFKSACHSCKFLIDPSLLVPCKNTHCNYFFCHKCLTRHYKYSKAKVVRLPTANWRCPYCVSRCQCDDCVKAGRGVPVKKKVMNSRDIIRKLYKKKRTRKRKYKSNIKLDFGIRDNSSKAIIGVSVEENQSYLLPPISGKLK